MSSASKSQQRLFGQVHNCQKNGICSSEKVSEMASKISPKDVEDFARTKHKGLPERVENKQEKKSRFTSYKEYQAALDEDFADRMANTQVRGNVQRRTSMLNQSSANERNVFRQMKTVWDVLVSSNLPPAQVMKIARNYVQQYNQKAQNQGQNQNQQGV